MRLARLGASILLLLLACTPPQERAERARDEALAALARGDRVAALRAIDDLRDARPDTPEAQIELATLLVGAGEAPQALWLLEERLRRSPERADLRIALAQVALLVNDPSRARAAVVGVGAESEHHLRALVMRGQAELALGDLERALATFEEAERLYPERPQARFVRILTLLREQRIEEARALLDEAKRATHFDDGSEEALRQLEIHFYATEAGIEGRSEPAAARLRALVEEDPDDVQAWQALVPILWRLGRAAEAAELLEAALAANPERRTLLPLLASLQAALGRTDEADRSLRAYLDHARSPSAYLALARIRATSEEPERLLALYEEGLEAFPDDATLLELHAEALVSAGRVEDARAALARFVAAAPADPRAEYLRARIELAEGDAASAVRRLEQWIPELDQGVTQYWLGRALEAAGDTAGAERRYGMAIARSPSEPGAYLAAIALAERRGDWRMVVANARPLVQRAPGRFEGWRALIAALVNLREGEPAEPLAKRCVELFPDRPEAQVLLATALRSQGRHAEALERLAEAGNRFGHTPEIEAEHALTEGMSGRLPEAIARAQRALEASPDAAQLELVLAALLFRAGAADEATRAVERALALAPDDPRPLRIQAEFHVAAGQLAAARSAGERYLALRPDDPTVHFILAAVEEKSGNATAAIAAYRRAAELDPAGFAARNNLAGLLAAQGDLDGALEAAQQAYALAEGNPYVMDTLGSLYLRKGLIDRSISLLEDAHARAPELPDAQLHLALAYREARRTEEARRLLSELRSRGGEDARLRAEVEEALASLR